ncbi:Na+/H+ antiporter family protein [Terribacillus saccharophilus]|uniref:Sodium:proton antiporter n=1 Tax=Terribacillus saccharophilus TaxID=361277 RepID=A0ABX4GXE1_9BACI|nr:Na+/H+ antiporter NhaC family protein [Terribacillus saccharophilus]PAD35425.1 sodium:proton antiporter [Terribacillus saccharophilus]PAD96180.1 sodium:proton antiporter [Terribacillus saccharophilus]PAD99484.1 sodium:proton antiporter [Terribacillus saccharophilus]
MNAVVIGVVLVLILSLLRVNVVFSLICGALFGGLVGGLGMDGTLTAFTDGVGGGAEVALSYAMLGGFAVAIASTGLPEAMVRGIISISGKKDTDYSKKRSRAFVLILILIMACLSQNAIPVHIAFIPLLIPPLLSILNDLQIDRRLTATILTFGLVTPYMALPIGYGEIFQGLVASNIASNGLEVTANQVTKAMILPACGMVVGLLIALITYRKPRVYEKRELPVPEEVKEKSQFKVRTLIFSILAIVAALSVQIWTDSMIFGALAGIIILYATGTVKWKEADAILTNGMRLMAFIGFVMIAASGFANVIGETGDVEGLVKSAANAINGSQALGALLMLVVGLLVTMGIGSSFSTIPVIATIFVPLAAELGFSPLAIIALVGTAGALGDAGSPASDSTLGPTAGLNADGQHNHIWDSVVPTFLHYNLPVIALGWIAAMIL